ncbi:MAG: hypothetical protein GY928_06715 [Colwellia sp.]|nr:hypothetical protein [Colwellia sp.]
MSNSYLIKMIFEVDPLICPECVGEMKIVLIIDRHQKDVAKKILKNCDLWDDSSSPITPNLFEAEHEFTEEVTIDLDFFDMIA